MKYQYFEIANEFISTLGSGYMPGVIYDSAVIGSLKDNTDISLFPNQVKLVLEKQFSDGSWGADYFNPYDRLLSTVATLNMIYELKLTKDENIKHQFQYGINWLEHFYDSSFNYAVPMPVGFEFLFPYFAGNLMENSNNLTLNLSKLEKDKQRKLDKLGDIIFSVPTPLLFSIEGVINKKEQTKQISKFQSPNGSIGTSPAATTVLIKHKIKDSIPSAMKFLNESISKNGLFSHFNDYQHMNISFSLYPLIKADYQFGVQGLHISKLLNEGWTENGVAFGNSFLSPDSDDTAMVLLDLNFLGNETTKDRMDILLKYEKENYFETYFGEINPALMTNIHVFEAFLNIDHPRSGEIVNKLTKFVIKNKDDLLNISKYNSSLLIQQSSLILSLFPKLSNVAEPLLLGLENHTRAKLVDVSNISTEEIAHTLLAFLYAKKCLQQVDEDLIKSLHELLLSRLSNSYHFQETFTWSAKVQYSPTQISQGHVIAALMLFNQTYY